MERHKKLCSSYEAVHIKMPKENACILKFKKFQARFFAPIVLYFDLESLLLPVHTAFNNPKISSSNNIEKHVPSGFCITAIEQSTQKQLMFKLVRSPNCMSDSIKTIESLAYDIHNRKQQHKIFTGQLDQTKSEVKACWICGLDFNAQDIKVLDHCHYSGEFLSWAHNTCNLKRRSLNFTPVVAHNLSNYDLHHICQAIQYCSSNSKLQVIPQTDEKYVCLIIRVKVGEYKNKKGELIELFENMRFLDSFRFMGMSLEKLVSFLPTDGFKIIDNHFEEKFAKKQIKLLHQKSFYPYSYFDNFERFSEKRLPPLNKWKNTLAGGEVSITLENLAHANQVFRTFKCKTLGDYHDLYLTTDTLLLACVFEKFRKVCYETYGLDCAQYFSPANLAGDAYLKTCNINVRLLEEREHLDMAENLMRGGMSSVYSSRLFKANNKYLQDFDETVESSFGFTIDSNNLYGGIMQTCCLPIGDFELVEMPLSELLQTPEDSPYGFIVGVDLEYPPELHDIQSDYQLAPTRESVEVIWLSQYQENLRNKMNVRVRTKSKKLLQTMFAKPHYTLHYFTLQLYSELNLKVTKVHRVLRFLQGFWLAPYIELNSRKRE